MTARPDTPISRREFVSESAAALVLTALAVAGCGSAEGSRPAAVARSPWIRVAVADLELGRPGWVEFDIPADTAPATPSVVRPTGTPADSLPSSRGAAWLVLQPDGSVIAFSPKCTHRGCLYDWDAPAVEFRCRCHPGLFSIDGRVISGPPPRPLDRFETRPAGDGLVEVGWVDQA